MGRLSRFQRRRWTEAEAGAATPIDAAAIAAPVPPVHIGIRADSRQSASRAPAIGRVRAAPPAGEARRTAGPRDPARPGGYGGRRAGLTVTGRLTRRSRRAGAEVARNVVRTLTRMLLCDGDARRTRYPAERAVFVDGTRLPASDRSRRYAGIRVSDPSSGRRADEPSGRELTPSTTVVGDNANAIPTHPTESAWARDGCPRNPFAGEPRHQRSMTPQAIRAPAAPAGLVR